MASMSAAQPKTPAIRAARPARSDRFHRWRMAKDKLARWSIGVGGVGVIIAVVLIFFYLLWVVFPLFLPADVELEQRMDLNAWASETPAFLALEEQGSVAWQVDTAGDTRFFSLGDGRVLQQHSQSLRPGEQIRFALPGQVGSEQLALVTSQGRVQIVKADFRMDFSQGVENRSVVPSLEKLHPDQELSLPVTNPVAAAYTDDDGSGVVALAGADGEVAWLTLQTEANLITGAGALTTRSNQVRLDADITGLAITGDQRWLLAADAQGRIHRLSLATGGWLDTIQASGAAITALTPLLGEISVLAGDANGGVAQLFLTREDDTSRLRVIRRFEPMPAAVSHLLPEHRRKGFAVLDDGGNFGLYHSTAGQRVELAATGASEVAAAAIAPRANQLLLLDTDNVLQRWTLDNPHPEVSWSSLWGKVWYENYDEPAHIWQSSAANNDFEPKFSLTPLTFGTLKAALYAMMFAIPLALMGAAYTAFFMAPKLRRAVKPTVEIMEALPTVILGFLAGLWFAPYVELHLAGIFTVVLLVPPGLLVFAYLWQSVGEDWLEARGWRVPDGWWPALLLPVVIVLTWLALALAAPLEAWLFGGDFRLWITRELGIDYDQRNALVVGFAMGFAVIPTIFSIAEDAIFGVPRSLSNGSLALGATPWQSLVRVVLPTASPGIFSGLMIGLGRAVGETMIVLMATGNTPVMDWNIFEGMRTLSANIAVEMPESEVASTHYRILFLAALVLFGFTFIVNTAAELIRQRLRERYSSL